MRTVETFAPTNIALSKYWGKRDRRLNLPCTGSISISLRDFGTKTQLKIGKEIPADSLDLNGKKSLDSNDPVLRRAIRVLDRCRELSGKKMFAEVISENNFPTSAGLASSASGLAALALAAARAFDLNLDAHGLSALARFGSGSACRSVVGGFVEWQRGELADGSDSTATVLAEPHLWPLEVVVVIVRPDPKDLGSTDGMVRTQETSPYFQDWVATTQSTLPAFRAAIQSRDFSKLARLAEENCLRMHACAAAASPPILYWEPATLQVVKAVEKMRRDGLGVFFTVDAGPNVVLVCDGEEAAKACRQGIERMLNGFSRTQTLKTCVGGEPGVIRDFI